MREEKQEKKEFVATGGPPRDLDTPSKKRKY